WQDCNSTQRNRSRRKHDRQQGDRLNAMGKVSFEVLENGAANADPVIDTMFQQRSARFRAMGVRDAFVRGGFTEFYRRAMDVDSGIDVRLHVLRLEDEIVATRYNIVVGERMFC